MNRAEDDRRRDGVMKTQICWDVPIYREPLPEWIIETLLDRYRWPDHDRLAELETGENLRLGRDCLTMATTAPLVGPGH